ncbi:MAG: hypothetical protein CM1200mP27_07660 [Chloroflexota bacterium]|nr:MAG: hypothetical protein CM1200mP27_07660 [Chloroflexota bacterium]
MTSAQIYSLLWNTDKVAERIKFLPGQHNVRYYTAHFSYGSMEHDKVMRAMKLFAEEVMPKFR